MITISAPAFDTVAFYGMILVVTSVASAASWLYGRGSTRRTITWLIGMIGVMAGSAAAASSGLLSSTTAFPPPMGVMIAVVLIGSVALGLSRVGATVAQHTGVMSLVALQIFRLPLELVMHHASTVGIMPEQLSYSGYNFDIVTGIGALLLTLLSLRGQVHRGLLWAWNIWGILCLTAIAAIAITTSPMVHAFGTEPANVNTWVLFFPYVWLPVILVSTAVFSHVVITRTLFARQSS